MHGLHILLFIKYPSIQVRQRILSFVEQVEQFVEHAEHLDVLSTPIFLFESHSIHVVFLFEQSEQSGSSQKKQYGTCKAVL